MKHDEIIEEICTRASDRRLMWHYCEQAFRCTGTPGFPDLVIAGPHAAVFLEVKTDGDKQRPGQVSWMYNLTAGGEHVFIVRERDLRTGMLDALLEMAASAGKAPADNVLPAAF